MGIVKGLEKRNIKSIIKNSIIQKTFVTLYQKNKKPIIIYLNLSDKVQELNRFTSVMLFLRKHYKNIRFLYWVKNPKKILHLKWKENSVE